MYRNPRRSYACFLTLCIMSSLAVFWILTEIPYNWKNQYFRNNIIIPMLTLPNNTNNEKEIIWNNGKNSALLIDTPGCKIPRFDPYDPTVLNLLSTEPPHVCPGKPLFLHTQPNGSITLNETILSDFYNLTQLNVTCVYQGIRRKQEKAGNTRENNYEISESSNLTFGQPLNEDHVMVQCELGEDHNLTQLIPIPRLIEKVEMERSNKKPFIPHLNVILVGVDSISKLNFHRHFRETKAFLEETLTPFDMKGYMKIGDNTFPNLIGLLSGHFAQDVWNETVKDTMSFDNVDLIWKRYAARGYRTLFAEDMPLFGTFNMGKRGFFNQPTDYYFRPLSLALRQSELYKNSKDYCLNSQTESDIIFQYLKDFVSNMGPRPYFAFAMISSLTHDYINYAARADRPAVKLLRNLWDMGALNNSVLVFFGDHGLRFGGIRKTYIGKLEERMPFMFLHFPKWFLSQYPNYTANLLKNQERLMTLFDVHATLIHLLEPYQELSEEVRHSSSPYGTSLLHEISEYRTCEEASIIEPWCVCQIFHEESTTEKAVVLSATAIVKFINEKLDSHNSSCATLELSKIVKASYGQFNDLVLRFSAHENVVINRYVVYGERIETYVDYVITLTTEPGTATFEGTVRKNKEKDSYNVLFVKLIDEKAPYCFKN